MNYGQMSDEQLATELLGADAGDDPAAFLRCREIFCDGTTVNLSQVFLRHRLDAAKELLMRELRASMSQAPFMNASETIRDWLRLYCAGLKREVFIGLFLDSHLRLIECETLFLGTLTQTSVYPREVVKTALMHNAGALAVAHNHPSGNVEPSTADEFLTQTLKSALQLVDVRLLDHFVVAGDKVVSLAERGLV